MSPRQNDNIEMEMEDEEPQERTRRPRKQAKLFADSNLTDAERREIRLEQRAIQQTIRDGACATVEDLETAREANNEIFSDKVCFTREGKQQSQSREGLPRCSATLQFVVIRA
jgi:hypothetical protein